MRTPRLRAHETRDSLLLNAARRCVEHLAGSWEMLPRTAVRFGLSNADVSSVLIGVRTRGELDEALDAMAEGPLNREQSELAEDLALNSELPVDPRNWSMS